MENKEQLKDTFEKALQQRDMYLSKYKKLDRIVKDGINHLVDNSVMPDRWYVRNPSESVISYLNKKYGTTYDYENVKNHGIGLGEIYGELAVVPDDVNYCWWITNEEFEMLIGNNNPPLTFEQCLREEFLLNTHHYPKEYHKLFWNKFKRAEKRFKEQHKKASII